MADFHVQKTQTKILHKSIYKRQCLKYNFILENVYNKYKMRSLFNAVFVNQDPHGFSHPPGSY